MIAGGDKFHFEHSFADLIPLLRNADDGMMSIWEAVESDHRYLIYSRLHRLETHLHRREIRPLPRLPSLTRLQRLPRHG
ncbi:MAG TPA: hypothetical protein VGV62_12845, partial [Xanthobacteraceae bacterium]|nr:hypothetical protein [Xanthobacteraceae bacterium]